MQADVIKAGLGESRWGVGWFVVLTAIASACTMASPLIVARVVQAPGPSGRLVLVSIALFAGAIAAARFLQDIRVVLTNRIQQRVANLANTAVLRRLLAADSALLDSNNPARIATVVQTFNQSNKMYVQMFLMVIVGGAFDIVLSFLVIGSYVNWTIGIAVVVYGSLTTWLTLRANDATTKYLQLAQAKSNEGANLLGNMIANVLSLKIFQGIEWGVRANDGLFQESRRAWGRFYSRRVKFGGMQSGLLFAQYLLVFGLLLWAGGAQLGQLVVLVLVLTQLNRPFEMMATAMRDFVVAKSMATPLQELLDAHTPPPDEAVAVLPEHGELEVVLDEVGYAYSAEGEPVLHGVSTTFRAGRVNFIVGPSGVGKSTLMRLLLGTRKDYRGSITVGGVELSTLHSNSYWSQVGYVPQDPMMMNASIRENVLFGRTFTDAEVRDTLESVELGAKLAALDEGLDFRIGERGALLSGGERQRLALARALIGRPRLLLLDEPSSALDETTEASIFEQLRASPHRMTTIAITHRTGLVQSSDSVLSLHNSAKVAIAVG
ncbi:ABC transporter ATP-binding protein [Nocardia sp. NPDC048505]|uniref:ABC transporter ATP-binding protein n=1 Tax=Nocardia sp. NPDC048505 TaxID=3155756 RepID=UPI0033C2786C